MKAVVLAGGLGTRLRNRIADLPKPMAPIADRPFLEYVLDLLVAARVESIILSIGYLGAAIANHIGHSYRGVPISYAREIEPLGTGGAIAHALQGLPDEPVLALNGDTLLKLDFDALANWYFQAPEPLAMVLRQVPDAGRYGAIQLDGERVSGFAERGAAAPGLINGGIYVLRPSLFSQLGLSQRFSFEADVLQQHCHTLRPRAYLTNAYFIDIGIPEDLDRAIRELPLMTPGT